MVAQQNRWASGFPEIYWNPLYIFILVAIIINLKKQTHRVFEYIIYTCAFMYSPLLLDRPRSIVVRASAQGAGGRGSIPDRVTPKT